MTEICQWLTRKLQILPCILQRQMRGGRLYDNVSPPPSLEHRPSLRRRWRVGSFKRDIRGCFSIFNLLVGTLSLIKRPASPFNYISITSVGRRMYALYTACIQYVYTKHTHTHIHICWHDLYYTDGGVCILDSEAAGVETKIIIKQKQKH